MRTGDLIDAFYRAGPRVVSEGSAHMSRLPQRRSPAPRIDHARAVALLVAHDTLERSYEYEWTSEVELLTFTRWLAADLEDSNVRAVAWAWIDGAARDGLAAQTPTGRRTGLELRLSHRPE